jgi:predicted N-acyltransferase
MGHEMAKDFEILTASSVNEVGEEAWDSLSASRPFQSARWYRFGERVMQGCQPIYIILSMEKRPIARATFWVVREEPLPVAPFLRTWLKPILRRWPLLVCRSPLSNSSGLILPEPPLRESALEYISEAASKELRRLGGSFLVFDYLEARQATWPGWPSRFKMLQIADPGTRLALEWNDFDAYLRSNPKFRIHQHFKRSRHEAAELGIQITRQDSCSDPSAAMELIRNLERRHASTPNPWVYNMLQNMKMVEGTWLAAHIGDRLVGCMLLLADNGVQIASLPGLTDDVPFAYFMLLYEAIQDALERRLGILRWGSGAYETKRRLGFELEDNNHVVFQGNGWLPRWITRIAAS